jgi:hypothetical protein
MKIPYLKLSHKENYNNIIEPNVYEINCNMEELKKDFPKQNFMLDSLIWKIELKALKIYASIVGDVIPPILSDAE